MIYLLDSNVFIESHRRYYGMDFAPGFWDILDRGFVDGSVCSINRVHAELVPSNQAQHDELSKWVIPRHRCFPSLDANALRWMRNIASWVMNPSRIYTDAAKSEFLNDVADYPLIAFAKAHQLVLVTQEKSDPNCKRHVKIPDVCIEFDVKYVDTFTMIRNKGAKFVLA